MVMKNIGFHLQTNKRKRKPNRIKKDIGISKTFKRKLQEKINRIIKKYKEK